MFRPRTNRQLWAFIGAYFDLWLPFTSYTPGNSNPFAFVVDAFFHPADDLAAWSCRSGGKTLCGSVIAALEYQFTDGIQARVLSGSEDQAKFLYEYWQNWCHGFLSPRLNSEPTRFLTRVAGGRFEILAASQKRVRGPKIQRLYQDEVDEIDPEIGEVSLGMLASRPDLSARTIYASTWHRIGGPMGKLVRACPGNGVRLHKWNLWEAIGNCPESRHRQGRGCRDCPLAVDCVAKAQEYFRQPNRKIGIAADARGIFAVEDACKIWLKNSRETVEAEYLCKRPSPQGLVYFTFDESVHVRKAPPEHLEIYRAIDWGYNVFVCLWLGVDKNETVWLLDTYRAETGTVKQHAEALKSHRIEDISATYCDPAGRNKNDQTGRSNIDEFKSNGIECRYTLARQWTEIANGIRLLRSFLKPASGPARFFVVDTPANRRFTDDIQGYVNRKVNDQYIDEPVKPQESDHTMDALRYFFVNRMAGRGGGVVKLGAS